MLLFDSMQPAIGPVLGPPLWLGLLSFLRRFGLDAPSWLLVPLAVLMDAAPAVVEVLVVVVVVVVGAVEVLAVGVWSVIVVDRLALFLLLIKWLVLMAV